MKLNERRQNMKHWLDDVQLAHTIRKSEFNLHELLAQDNHNTKLNTYRNIYADSNIYFQQ